MAVPRTVGPVAKKIIECRTCLRRMSGDAAGWVVEQTNGGVPEYLCPGCAGQDEPS